MFDHNAPIPVDCPVFYDSQKRTPPAGTGGNKFETTKYRLEDSRIQARIEKYRAALAGLPQRGGGLHSALLSVCNLGISAGLADQQLFNEIRATGRAFRRGEIEEAIAKSHDEKTSSIAIDTTGKRIQRYFTEHPDEAESKAKELVEKGGGNIDPFSVDLWEESSPHPGAFDRLGGLDGSERCADMLLFLQELYSPDEFLYIGNMLEKFDRQPEHVKTISDWIKFFSGRLDAITKEPEERKQFYMLQELARDYQFFIVNPLTGKPGTTKDGKPSYRSDSCIKSFRYVLVEPDNLPLEKQIALMRGLKLPVASMTFSGGKSIHALLNVSTLNGKQPITDIAEWRRVVQSDLFGRITASVIDRKTGEKRQLMFDPATSNASRQSRLPGIWREDKNRFQQLIFINRKETQSCQK